MTQTVFKIDSETLTELVPLIRTIINDWVGIQAQRLFLNRLTLRKKILEARMEAARKVENTVVDKLDALLRTLEDIDGSST